MLNQFKLVAKTKLVSMLYRYPPTGLQPDRLATYISGLLERRRLNLPVAEVGCHLGGTSILAYRALRRNRWTSTYTCFDTFGGFVADQFETDVSLGTPLPMGSMFSQNSVELVRKITQYHDCGDIRLVRGDITRVPDSQLEPLYSAVLLDIDLSEPTYVALGRFWPRLAPGGVIYVDDCPAEGDWKARVGYKRFCEEHGLPERYEYGLGVLVKEPKRSLK